MLVGVISPAESAASATTGLNVDPSGKRPWVAWSKSGELASPLFEQPLEVAGVVGERSLVEFGRARERLDRARLGVQYDRRAGVGGG